MGLDKPRKVERLREKIRKIGKKALSLCFD